jgi:hypothetical protein
LASRARPSWLTVRVASAFAAAAAIAIVVQLALLERAPPVRCPAGLVLFPARCCGAGQTLVAGHCDGRATSCGANQRFIETEGEPVGCVFDNDRVELRGGRLPAGAVDWQVASAANALEVAPFAIDRGEVTAARYAECVRAGDCTKVVSEREPGLPVSGLSPEEAARFCAFAGGRLPSSAEWRFAASGAEGRRFPWGFTGLVCRRATFGLLNGPCGSEASGPDLVGARPDGATPDGIVDLSGNVAEWTLDPDGRARARGGSYRSRVAAELVTAAVEVADAHAMHVGFRCAYDAL